jgi:hypothetical protein
MVPGEVMVSNEIGPMIPENAFVASENAPAVKKMTMIALGIARMIVSMR